MDQHHPLYVHSPAVQTLADWLTDRLPRLDSSVRQRVLQLCAGMLEAHSVLVEQIAASSAFRAPEDSSNYTQVQRILRDTRISVEDLYFPLIKTLLREMDLHSVYLTIDESSHTTAYGLFQIGLATDGIVLPLGWVLYEPDDAWAEDARSLLQTIATLLPTECHVILLADRLHTGEPFLSCITALGWDYVMRAKADILIETPHGWKQFYARTLPHKQGRFFTNVRIWKTRKWRTNVSIYKHVKDGFRPVTWFVISSLPAGKERFLDYAYRWWQECGFRDLKSDVFQWERSRVRNFDRVDVLLIAISLTTWVYWMLGRAHERIPKGKRKKTGLESRRVAIIKQGIAAFKRLVKHGYRICLGPMPQLRVHDYPTTFTIDC